MTDRLERDWWTGEPTGVPPQVGLDTPGRDQNQINPLPTSLARVGYAGPATPRPPRTHPRGLAAYAAMTLAVLQVPWVCGGLFRVTFDVVGGSFNPVDRHNFVVGRAVMVGPAILATALACFALVGRRPGAYRTVARVALGLALALLFLTNAAVKFHAGA